MTLPPTCFPSESVPQSGDQIATLGQSSGTTENTDTAPFAELLSGVVPAPAQNTSAAADAQLESTSSPAGVPSPLLYPGRCCTNMLQSTVTEESDASVEPTLEDPVESDDTAVPEDDSALQLAYQLIAGLWVPQPVNLPVEPADPQEESTGSADATALETGIARYSGFGLQQNSTASVVTSAQDGLTNLANTSLANAKPADAKPANPAAPATVTDTLDQTKALAVSPDATLSVASSSTSKIELPDTPKSEVAAQSAADNTALATTPVQATLRSSYAQEAKIAAPSAELRAETASGVNSSNQTSEKKTLVTDAKGLKSTGGQVGTGAANRDYSMPYSAANKTSEPSVTALPQATPVSGLQSGTTAPVAETSAASSVQAPRLVQEIRAIADRISTIDRNTVEVRFDFNESDRLSVRVEYRDGTVHTTFQTNSEPLREAIAREWQVQAVSAVNSSYRVAEPVFSSNQSAASTDLSQSDLGSGQSNARSYEQQASSFAGLVNQGRSSAGASSSASTANVPVTIVRPETSLHLHTFA